MDSVSAPSVEQDRLRLWEQAVGRERWCRDQAMLRMEGDPPTLLGARNAALLALRTRLFGNSWPLRSDCPACSRVIQFSVDSARLAQECVPDDSATSEHELQVDGHVLRFRLPRIDDLRNLAHGTSIDEAATALLRRCVVSHGPANGAEAEALPASVGATLSQRMEALDPGASLSFTVTCPDCGHAWRAPVDVGDALWSELQASVERTLLEVDVLARAYGWSETQVLALSPMRRAAYLQLAGAG